MNQHFLEKCRPAAGFVPVNMATAANTGDRFDMKNYGRVAIVFFKGAGNAAEDPTITVQQHNAASSGTSKALPFTRVDHKIGTLASVGEFTTVTQAAAETFTLSTLGDSAAIVVIDIKAEDLDIDGGFEWISANVADVGSVSQVGCVLYFGHEPRNGGDRMNQHFCEKYQIVAGFAPVDMSTSSGPTSDVVSMKNFHRCAVVYFSAVGAAGRDTTLTLQQAQLVAGTPKNLNFGRIDVMQDTDITGDDFTETANSDHDYTSDTSGEAECIWVVDVPAESLDIDNGYDSIVASVNDHSGAKLGCVLYLLHDPRYASGTLPSAIAD
jgi:hypothetical protein